MRMTSKNKLVIKDVLKRTGAFLHSEVGYLNSETDRRMWIFDCCSQLARSVLSEIAREFAYEVSDSSDERKEFLKEVMPPPRFTAEDHNHICRVCNLKGWCEDDPVAKEIKEEITGGVN